MPEVLPASNDTKSLPQQKKESSSFQIIIDIQKASDEVAKDLQIGFKAISAKRSEKEEKDQASEDAWCKRAWKTLMKVLFPKALGRFFPFELETFLSASLCYFKLSPLEKYFVIAASLLCVLRNGVLD